MTTTDPEREALIETVASAIFFGARTKEQARKQAHAILADARIKNLHAAAGAIAVGIDPEGPTYDAPAERPDAPSSVTTESVVINVGRYALARMSNGMLWLSGEGAEGMQVNETQLALAMERFYDEHF